MPIYEYHCKTCKRDFEILQKISDPALATCPRCGKKVKRLISQTSFALKGGGWYKDGYASGGGKSASFSKGSETKSSSSETKSSPTETKSEKKAEKAPAKKE